MAVVVLRIYNLQPPSYVLAGDKSHQLAPARVHTFCRLGRSARYAGIYRALRMHVASVKVNSYV